MAEAVPANDDDPNCPAALGRRMAKETLREIHARIDSQLLNLKAARQIAGGLFEPVVVTREEKRAFIDRMFAPQTACGPTHA